MVSLISVTSRQSFALALALALTVGLVAGPIGLLEAAPPATAAFLERHCFECHDGAARKAGLDLEHLEWAFDDRARFERWVRVFDRVERGEMPPSSVERPEKQDQSAFLAAVASGLQQAGDARHRAEGRVGLRRLNRVEFENSVRDLLGIDMPLKHLLPEDSPAQGFDTVADGLRISALSIEKVLEAADLALDAAVELGEQPERIHRRFDYRTERGVRENLDTPDGAITEPAANARHRVIFKELPDAVVFFSDTYSPTDLRDFTVVAAGDYKIKVSAFAYQADGRPVSLLVYADNYRNKRLIGHFDISSGNPREVEFTARLERNEHLKVAPHGTGYNHQGKTVWEVDGGATRFDGLGLAVRWLEVEGPLLDRWPPPSVERVLGEVALELSPPNQKRVRDGKVLAYRAVSEQPSRDLGKVVERFAARAFRRPLEPNEADPFISLGREALEQGRDFEDAVKLSLRGVLTSPQFLLLAERPGPLEDHAIAARLSYFLWSTMPDEELLQRASAGDLSRPDVLKDQVERLLASPKAERLVTNFVGQWLDLRRIDATSPDGRLYPEYDEMLKLAMVGETEAFCAEMLRNNLSVTNFVDSDFLMLNRRIAEHYGIEGVVGEEFRRVKLPSGSPRGGLLGQASVLKVTANGTVTSPVLRGVWVLKRLLGESPPPPPPVPAIEPDTRGSTTIREQLAKHRNSPTCASCHRSIDPPGFALECFDVIGGYRERYRSLELGERPPWKHRGRDIWEYKLGPKVDSGGELEDGRQFGDVEDFKRLLIERRDDLLRSLAEKLVTYGTGAGVDFADRRAVVALVERVQAQGGGLRTLIHEIIQSPLFLNK